MISRRDFIGKALGAAGAAAILSSCTVGNKLIKGNLLGPNFALGHKLRTMDFGPTTSTISVPVTIVGGGVGGLSAGWFLKKHKIDFRLLELESFCGGNAISGENNISAYPWGAHYLPVPNTQYQPLMDFLSETNVITGWQDGLPVYNDYYLCFEPKERLYIHEHWQEGLVPVDGVPMVDRQEIQRFMELMQQYKSKRGVDGREAFCIPTALCSDDPEFKKFDTLSMQQFLVEEGFRSNYLYWYVNYCCADDYGASIESISAWAGIHYFASRKGVAHNAESDDVLTWPEGNGWLTKQLKSRIDENVTENALVYNLSKANDKISLKVFDAAHHRSYQIISDQVILATPQFINQRLLSSFRREIDYRMFVYSPWMTANISLSGMLDEKRGEELSWDNVIYGNTSLGYINAKQQSVKRFETQNVITYYLPYVHRDANFARKSLYETTFETCTKTILTDLKGPHPKLIDTISNIDVWRWGHGMIRPIVDFDVMRTLAVKSVEDKIHFAHSDISGISIFEEAFYNGVEAAKKIISR